MMPHGSSKMTGPRVLKCNRESRTSMIEANLAESNTRKAIAEAEMAEAVTRKSLAGPS